MLARRRGGRPFARPETSPDPLLGMRDAAEGRAPLASSPLRHDAGLRRNASKRSACDSRRNLLSPATDRAQGSWAELIAPAVHSLRPAKANHKEMVALRRRRLLGVENVSLSSAFNNIHLDTELEVANFYFTNKQLK